MLGGLQSKASRPTIWTGSPRPCIRARAGYAFTWPIIHHEKVGTVNKGNPDTEVRVLIRED
jgi:hypothetical protein